jgi:hypothetical protein
MRLLTEWIVACDQPFEEVERPQFQALLRYVHRQGQKLNIPTSTTIRRWVADMGKDVIEDMKNFIVVCGLVLALNFNDTIFMFSQALDGKVSLSLDAWTSSNGYAFLAIIMHYVSKESSLGNFYIIALY